ncbi:MAG: ELM1/GtrOC1 family putative glycosyltransferase [Desulfuromonadales bacterium]
MPEVNILAKDGAETLLILSDGKPGHLNQSIAFARLLQRPYQVREVRFVSRLAKACSYPADRLGLTLPGLFRVAEGLPACEAVVSAGSETYYANRVLSKRLQARSVAIMLPRGYRYAFDLIVAQQHDRPSQRDNILVLPVNLSCPEPQGLVAPRDDRPCVSLIIGGTSRHFRIDVAQLTRQMEQIFRLFPGADFFVTTSRRTPAAVEALVERGPFRYKVIASRDAVNPIADFLAISDYVFVTEDSTSMISEAVSFGLANVEVLPLVRQGRPNKIQRMTKTLSEQGYLHLFDGFYGDCHRKLDLRARLREVWS